MPDLREALASLPTHPSGDPLFEALAARAIRQGHTVRVRRRLTLAAVPALAAVAAGAVLVTRDHDDSLRPGPSASEPATELLARVAASAAALPDTGRDAPFWFSEFSGESQAFDETTGELTRTPYPAYRVWLGHSTLSVYGSAPIMSADDRPAYSLQGLPDGPVDWDGLRDLPTDPERLRALFLRGTPPDDDGNLTLWRVFEGLLGGSPAPPALRGAVVQVAASLPEVTVTDGSDSTGRPAVVLSFAYVGDPGAVSRYFVDVRTAELLEIVEISGTAPGDLERAPAGTVVDRRTYRVSGPVPDSTTVLP